jgi:uncharacterized phage protein (TIGR01671 family)
MREIKFRAWVKKLKNPDYQKWVKDKVIDRNIGAIAQYQKETGKTLADGFVAGMDNNIHISNNGKVMQLEGGWDYFGDIEDAIIMQYTGLKDKNGKEIYEGDILKYYYQSALSMPMQETIKFFNVVFDKGQFLQWENGDCKEACDIWYDWNELEIIGNIYENKDLIK